MEAILGLIADLAQVEGEPRRKERTEPVPQLPQARELLAVDMIGGLDLHPDDDAVRTLEHEIDLFTGAAPPPAAPETLPAAWLGQERDGVLSACSRFYSKRHRQFADGIFRNQPGARTAPGGHGPKAPIGIT